MYSVYRSSGRTYYTVKLGLTNEQYQIYDDVNHLVFDDTHTGIARGLGIGYRTSSHKFELEYSLLGGSLEMLSMGAGFTFEPTASKVPRLFLLAEHYPCSEVDARSTRKL